MLKTPTDANFLEVQKENIQPLAGGRSAKKLAYNLMNSSQSNLKYREAQHKQRESFEEKLRKTEELDDPLQLYLDYIEWTHESYPQGCNAESGLLALLERCTSSFRDTPHYKNDPRYLRVWMEYCNYSDSPRDIFIYLAKKDIGTELALYYEEFARFLELNMKVKEAKQVFEVGIAKHARPFVRLEKNYNLFLRRTEELDEPLPQEASFSKRPLEHKHGESSSSIGDALGTQTKKRQKLQVFADEPLDDQHIFKTLVDNSPLVPNPQALDFKVKENRLSAKPWVGERIPQKTHVEKQQKKIEVFKDNDQAETTINTYQNMLDGCIHTVIKHPGKTEEDIKLNINLIYPSYEEEQSFPEILAKMKLAERKAQRSALHLSQLNNKPKLFMNNLLHDEVNDQSNTDLHERNHTLTIPLKDDDDDTNTSKKAPNSPTLTLFSRMATNEVMSMFNEAGKDIRSEDEEEDDLARNDGENSTNYDGFVTETIQLQPQGTQEAAKREYELRSPQRHSPPFEICTPPKKNDNDSVYSSPFIERPVSSLAATLGVVYPTDEKLRNELLDTLTTPLSCYSGFFDYSHTKISKLPKFKEVTNNNTKLIAKGARHSIIDYCGNEIYCLRCELGQGGYGIVYLVETETGEFKALKVESPPSKWEFYILNQIHTRLKKIDSSALGMIVSPDALYLFQDEAYLLMNYVNQGTILDVVNYFKAQGSAVDETLCIYLTAELLKVVEALHEIGIIHGDLKADNCMIKFAASDTWGRSFTDKDRSSSKTITLIDFGRAIDKTLFPEDTQFLANWDTDQQDCPQMRQGLPWSYEADYYGIAGIIHTMLFGKYIEVKNLSVGGPVALTHSFKRYWQVDLWSGLFDLLLNPYPDGLASPKEPLSHQLRAQRRLFEDWLQRNAGKKNLKMTISDVENEVNVSNRKLINSLR